MAESVEGGVIFLLGIGYVLLPEDEIKDVIADNDLAESYSRVFHIVPNPEDIPTYQHNHALYQWERQV